MSTSPNDIEGFLFGRVFAEKVKTIADSQPEIENLQTSIAIQSFQTIGAPFSFYDQWGAVNITTIRSILEQNAQPLVGWFKFRRNTSLRPSLRELAVHTSLQTFHNEYKQQTQPLPSSGLIFGILCQKESHNKAIHNYDYRFLQTNSTQRNQLDSILVSINNLVHSSQSEYNQFTNVSPSPMPLPVPGPQATNSAQQLPQQFNHQEGLLHLVGQSPPSHIQELERFIRLTMTNLEGVSGEVISTASELSLLESDIEKLQQAIQEKVVK